MRGFLDALSHGVIAVSVDWRAEFVNRAARDMLQQADALHIVDGRVEFRRDRDRDQATRWLSEIDARASSGSQRALVLPRASGRLPYVLHHVAWDAVGEKSKSAFGLLLIDPSKAPLVDAQVLVDVFGFTQSEAAISAALAQGQSIEAIARSRNIALVACAIPSRKALAACTSSRAMLNTAVLAPSASNEE